MAYGTTTGTLEHAPVPDNVPAELVREFDHFNNPDVKADPIGFYDPIRRSDHPVFWSPLHGGFWVFTRFDDILAVLQNSTLFRNEHMSFPGKSVWPRPLIPVEIDPPNHKPYRAIEARIFAPARMAELREEVRLDARELLRPILAARRTEFFGEFGQPLPTRVFCRLFGLPIEQADDFLVWENSLIHAGGAGAVGNAAEIRVQAFENISEYLSDLVRNRQAHPVDDLVSLLTRSEVEGRRLTFEEVFDMCFQLYVAGLDTVTSALSWAMAHLATNPEHRRQLKAEPGLIPNAIEEMLRRYSFITPNRVVQEDVDIAGVHLKKGDIVLMPLQSAGRDETIAENAGEVDLKRAVVKHLAFGAGNHRCVGSHLARIELYSAFEEWFERTRDFQLVPGEQPRYRAAGSSGVTYLPLLVEPEPAFA